MRFEAYCNGCTWSDEWDSPEEAAKAFAEDRVSRGKECSPVSIHVHCPISKRSWSFVVDVTPRDGYDCVVTSCFDAENV